MPTSSTKPDDTNPTPKVNRAMLFEEFPPTTVRQTTLAEMQKRRGKKRKASKVLPITKRTRDAATKIAKRQAAKASRGY